MTPASDLLIAGQSPAPDLTVAWLLAFGFACLAILVLLRHRMTVRELAEAHAIDDLANPTEWVTQPVLRSQASPQGSERGIGLVAGLFVTGKDGGQ